MRAIWLLLFVPPLVAFACSSDPEATPGGGASADAAPGDGSSALTDAAAADAASDTSEAGAPLGMLFGFVGSSDGKVRSYVVDAATGAWTLKKESTAGANPSFLAFDPARRRVVAVDETAGGLVRAFAFEPSSGTLTETNNRPSGGAGPAHLSLDPTGAWLMVANYTGGNMSILPIDAAGMIGVATDTKTSGAMSHWAATNPSGGGVFVPALGANVVAQYTMNATTGKLTDNGVAGVPSGSGPRHLAFHPNEKWAYLVNETAITVTTFDFDKVTHKLTSKQTISALPPGQSTAGVSGAEIFVHPSGRHVYASTRGFDSIVQLAVSATDGTLTRVANTQTGAPRPRSFGMDPDGTLLYAGNQDANQVVGFRINAATGALTTLGKTVDVAGPSFVGLQRMP
jgi:6-phosphogluconolactonase